MGNNTTGMDQGRVIVGTIVKRHLAPGGRAINFKDEDWLALPVGTALYAEIDPVRPLALVGPVGYIHAEELRRAQNASLVERVYVARKLSDTDNVPLFTAGGVITHQQLLDLYEAAYQDGQNNPNGYSSKAQRDEAVAAAGSVGGDDPGEVERLRAQVEQLKHIAQKNVDRNVDLSAQLAERDALLLRALPDLRNERFRTEGMAELYGLASTLSASAEPSAPVEIPVISGPALAEITTIIDEAFVAGQNGPYYAEDCINWVDRILEQVGKRRDD